MNAATAPITDAPPSAGMTFVRVPQVNLLPPEVAVKQGLRAVRRWALLALGVVVLVVALVYVVSSVELAQARGDLNRAQDTTARLTAEQASYSEVPQVLGELNDVKATQELATSTEVLWKPYIDSIRGALPEGGELSSLQASGASPVLLPPGPVDVRGAQGVGPLTHMPTTPTFPNVADWSDALSTVPGLRDARVQSVTEDSSSEGPAGYTVTMTMQYDETALSGRFAAEEEN